jgi:hypothetical protein
MRARWAGNQRRQRRSRAAHHAGHDRGSQKQFVNVQQQSATNHTLMVTQIGRARGVFAAPAILNAPSICR